MQSHFYSYLGIALCAKNDQLGAAQAFSKAIELDPNDAGAHHGYGLAMLQLGNVDEAEASSKKAKEIDKSKFKSQVEQGRKHIKAGERDKAFKVLIKALNLQED